jgi:hypothetical protein
VIPSSLKATPPGISIDFNPIPRNADFSNVTDSSDLHIQKLHLPKTTTEDGMKMDCGSDTENPESQILSKIESLSNATTNTRPKTRWLWENRSRTKNRRNAEALGEF